MAVAIKLSRFGKKHEPHYRIVVMDKAKKRDGKYIESIGYYNPFDKKGNEVNVNKERLNYWVEKGAILSEGVRKLTKSKLK